MSSIQRVQQALRAHHCSSEIKQLDDSAHTAQQAATALGCDVAQIVKSLVFKTKNTDQAVLALISGEWQLNMDSLAAVVGQPIVKADAQFVKSQTGFSIGGVAPLGSINRLPVYMDESLLRHNEVWAAGGHPKAIFSINPEQLLAISGAQALDLTSEGISC